MNSRAFKPSTISSSLLEPICRGLVGYLSYLATCRASTIYSEYLLYEPLMRIAQAKEYSVRCEYPVSKGPKGDAKRIDFLLTKNGIGIGIEVKWLGGSSVAYGKDQDKLAVLRDTNVISEGYLLLFGTAKRVEGAIRKLHTKGKISRRDLGRMVRWNSGHTSYGASYIRIA